MKDHLWLVVRKVKPGYLDGSVEIGLFHGVNEEAAIERAKATQRGDYEWCQDDGDYTACQVDKGFVNVMDLPTPYEEY